MEMFPAAAQPILDRYILGEITQENFLKEAGRDDIGDFPILSIGTLSIGRKENANPFSA